MSNLTRIRTDAAGYICVRSGANTLLLWEQLGAAAADPADTPATAPTRLLDTRRSSAAAAAGSVTRIPTGTTPVLLNVTAIPTVGGGGHTTIYPCSQPRPNTSTHQLYGTAPLPHTVATAAGADGNTCIYTSAATHLIVDRISAVPGDATANPARLLDTRTTGSQVVTAPAPMPTNPYGLAPSIGTYDRLLWGTLTVLNPTQDTVVGLLPCGADPVTSLTHANTATAGKQASFPITGIETTQGLCIFTSAPVHVIVDRSAASKLPVGYAETPTDSIQPTDSMLYSPHATYATRTQQGCRWRCTYSTRVTNPAAATRPGATFAMAAAIPGSTYQPATPTGTASIATSEVAAGKTVNVAAATFTDGILTLPNPTVGARIDIAPDTPASLGAGMQFGWLTSAPLPAVGVPTNVADLTDPATLGARIPVPAGRTVTFTTAPNTALIGATRLGEQRWRATGGHTVTAVRTTPADTGPATVTVTSNTAS